MTRNAKRRTKSLPFPRKAHYRHSIPIEHEPFKSRTQSKHQQQRDRSSLQGMVASPAQDSNDRKTAKRNIPFMRLNRFAISQKLVRLKRDLNPIPFVPSKTLDFTKHEVLFRSLGLWDFAHLALDSDIRIDILAALFANYSRGVRRVVVNDVFIKIGRADMARALKISIKKNKTNMLDFPDFDEEYVSVISDFIANYVLLHDDAWIMPDEVVRSIKAVEECQLQKVDWAGLIWFMVEKELMRGEKLTFCYYASHLQLLMKSQKPELFEGDPVEEVFIQEESQENDTELKNSVETREQKLEENQELSTPGSGKNKDEEAGLDGVLDSKLCYEDNGYWLKHCSLSGSGSSDCARVMKDQKNDLYGPPVNLERSALGRDSQVFVDTSSDEFSSLRTSVRKADDVVDSAGLVTSGNAFEHKNIGAYEIDNRGYLYHDDPQKKRTPNVSLDQVIDGFGVNMDQVQSWIDQSRIMYFQKVQEYMQAQARVASLTQMLQQRDDRIDELNKTMREEENAKEVVINRLVRELHVMTDLVDGYKRALKETRRQFAEYIEHSPLPVEPLYKDAGPGGLVLRTKELEKLQLEKEEKARGVLFDIKDKIKHLIPFWCSWFESNHDVVDSYDKRLAMVSNEVEFLKAARGGS